MRMEIGNYTDLKYFADQQSEGNVSQLIRKIVDEWLREEKAREIRRGKYQKEKKFAKQEKAKKEKINLLQMSADEARQRLEKHRKGLKAKQK